MLVLPPEEAAWRISAPHLNSDNPEFKSRSDHQLELFQAVTGSTPRLRLYTANWPASCQLGFFICLLYSVAICTIVV